ncbi:MAG TPA: HAMP domain-containing sensor histidine kinase [Kofleriaceae bacterium]|nr:HAMP domain-containing sensor histidine kinase [Kofleriaceae bacterium]
MGSFSADGVDEILDALKDPTWTRKVEALRIVTARLASGELPPDQENRFFASLSEASRDQKWEVRKGVALALAEVRQSVIAVEERLDELARDANRWVSQAADRAIRRRRVRAQQSKAWAITADVQDPTLQRIAVRIREIGLRSMTPALIYDLAMEISEQSYREVAADTAHEIRTLLTPFEGYLAELRRHLVAAGHTDPQAEHYLAAALGRLQQIQLLTENLRTYSMASETEFAPVEIATVVRDAVAIGCDQQGSQSGTIVRAVEVPDGLIVDAVRERLTRALANLITNACQAMPEGGHLVIQAKRVEVEFVEIIVSDTGHGMTPEVLEQSRLRFRTTRRDQGGTGLGLPIAERIVVHDHRGELNLESAVGQGTTATVRLPMRRRDG